MLCSVENLTQHLLSLMLPLIIKDSEDRQRPSKYNHNPEKKKKKIKTYALFI